MMIIDDSMVQAYLAGRLCNDHWIFDLHGFNEPDSGNQQAVEKLLARMKENLLSFTPEKYKEIQLLFPDFDEIRSHVSIIFCVGLRQPYDAIVRSHNGKEFVIFDLINIGNNADTSTINGLLLHEILHICLHEKYAYEDNVSFLDKMDYLVFDEGFAHALSYFEYFPDFKYDSLAEERYLKSLELLERALVETNGEKQEEYMMMANTGNYWEKFGAISGKMYLLKNMDKIVEIYNDGPKNFCKRICDDASETSVLVRKV